MSWRERKTDDPNVTEVLLGGPADVPGVNVVPGKEIHTPGPSKETIEELRRITATYGFQFIYE